MQFTVQGKLESMTQVDYLEGARAKSVTEFLWYFLFIFVVFNVIMIIKSFLK